MGRQKQRQESCVHSKGMPAATRSWKSQGTEILPQSQGREKRMQFWPLEL